MINRCKIYLIIIIKKYAGDGPFPSIIDMSGTGGGLNEHKGGALASRGFCVFSLAFFQYKDLIKELKHLDINYFKVFN